MKIAAIMCTWKRPKRFLRTLQMFAGQTDLDFDLYIWNNNPEIKEHIDSISSSYELPYRITIRHSEDNVKGFGRFLFAKELADRYDYFVFVDDDQDFGDKFIENFRNEANPDTIYGF